MLLYSDKVSQTTEKYIKTTLLLVLIVTRDRRAVSKNLFFVITRVVCVHAQGNISHNKIIVYVELYFYLSVSPTF